MSDDEYEYESESGGEDAPIKQLGSGQGQLRSGVSFPAGADYRLLSEEEIRGEFSALVGSTASTLNLPFDCASLLLAKYKYNKEMTMEKYIGDPKGLAKALGFEHMGKTFRSSKPFFCEVCLMDKGSTEGFSMGCGHMFCVDCWGESLSVGVKDTSTGGTCLSYKCDEVVTASMVTAMASPAVATKWRHFEQRNFVLMAKNMVWCPGQGCSNAFISRAPVKLVKCTCGCNFCFRCGKESHAPVACTSLEAWQEKCGSESETANWLLSYTKKCPMCASRIEKNQGCNHMKCINKACRHEFCWVRSIYTP